MSKPGELRVQIDLSISEACHLDTQLLVLEGQLELRKKEQTRDDMWLSAKGSEERLKDVRRARALLDPVTNNKNVRSYFTNDEEGHKP